MSKDLVKLDPIIQAMQRGRDQLTIALQTKNIPLAKQVYAHADTFVRWSKRKDLGIDWIKYGHKVKIESLCVIGDLLHDLREKDGLNEGGRKPVGKSTGLADSRPTLKDLGLDREIARIADQLFTLGPDVRIAIADMQCALTEALRQQRKDERPAIELPKDIYRVLYADPPWQYRDTRAGLGGESQKVDRATTAAAQNYPTMSVDELCALSVQDMAAPDAVLFCWATFPLLPDALRVVTAWGFTYKTAFVWKKPRGSFGHYHKADAELLLLATCGSCTPDSDTRYSQVIEAPTEGHSVKPECVRTMIDTLYSHGPRIELFARRPAPGDWTTWGNEPE